MSALRVDKSKKPYSRPASRLRAPDGEWLHDKAPLTAKVSFGGGNVKATASVNSKLMVSNLHYELTPKDLTGTKLRMHRIHLKESDTNHFRFNLFAIKYDRSGRSSGVAIITFETPAEAARAKESFEGKLLKGQPMSIAYDTMPPLGPRNTRRNSSAPSSLLQRIEKPALLDRLSRDDAQRKTAPPTAPAKNGVGPIRTKARAIREPKKPKSAQELDMELDAFMKDDVPVSQPSALSHLDADVEMA